MSTLEEVSSSKILRSAIFLVEKAKKEILATMDLTEEIKSPLPSEYLFLLKKKIETGTKIIRLAFGTRGEFKIFDKRCRIKNKNYMCVLRKKKNYKRMLLVDGKYLLFAVDNKKEKKFFYTRDPKYIEKFSDYFQNHFK